MGLNRSALPISNGPPVKFVPPIPIEYAEPVATPEMAGRERPPEDLDRSRVLPLGFCELPPGVVDGCQVVERDRDLRVFLTEDAPIDLQRAAVERLGVPESL